MSIRFPLFLVVILCLSGCFPKKPDIPGIQVSPEPCLRALEAHRASVVTLKALASVEISRKGKKRFFDTVGVLAETGSKFRIEAYDPLGLSLVELLWDGDRLLFSLSGEPHGPPPAGLLERLLGAQINPSELSAIVSGTIPDITGHEARAFRGQDAQCLLELKTGNTVRLVTLRGMDSEIGSYELIEKGKLVFRARFDRRKMIAAYAMPHLITIESPSRQGQLVFEYQDVELNVPLDESAFLPRN